MIRAVLRTIARVVFRIAVFEAAGVSGRTGARPGFSKGLNLPGREIGNRLEDIGEGTGQETTRFGPIVWFADAPDANGPATIEMPPMWARDP